MTRTNKSSLTRCRTKVITARKKVKRKTELRMSTRTKLLQLMNNIKKKKRLREMKKSRTKKMRMKVVLKCNHLRSQNPWMNLPTCISQQSIFPTMATEKSKRKTIKTMKTKRPNLEVSQTSNALTHCFI